MLDPLTEYRVIDPNYVVARMEFQDMIGATDEEIREGEESGALRYCVLNKTTHYYRGQWILDWLEMKSHQQGLHLFDHFRKTLSVRASNVLEYYEINSFDGLLRKWKDRTGWRNFGIATEREVKDKASVLGVLLP